MSSSSERISGLLADLSHPDSFSKLFQLTYTELRRIAGGYLKSERPGYSLPPTGLVHEAFLRLVKTSPKRYDSRRHYYGIAARTMRQVIVDKARKDKSQKRGGRVEKVPLESFSLLAPESLPIPDFLAVHEALDRLALLDAELAQIVEMLFFDGFTPAEAAAFLGMPERTFQSHWALARGKLAEYLKDEPS